MKEFALFLIPHIIKDSLTFMQRLRHDLFRTAIQYWIEYLQNNLPLFQRFTELFVWEGLPIILKFNYFYINKSFTQQIKETAMETKFSVVGSNLVVAYKQIKLFALLPQVYPQDFVDHISLFFCEYFENMLFVAISS